MAAFQPLPNGIKVTWVFELAGKPVTVTVYVTASGTVDTTQLQNAVSFANTVWAGAMKPAVSNRLFLRRIEALDVSVEDGEKRVLNAAANTQGDIDVEAMSSNVAGVISLRTAYTGRSRRGRMYMPGLAISRVLENTLDAAQTTAYATIAQYLRDEANNAGLQLVIASYWNNGVRRTTALATPVTGWIIPTTVKTQRRRLP